MKLLIQHIKRIFTPCECNQFDSYPHISILACKDCGTIHYTQGTLKCLQ